MSYLLQPINLLPLPAEELPLTIMSLDEWALVTICGEDTIKYLQGQFTCDISILRKNEHKFSGHCNEKGKIFSVMNVFYYEYGIAYIERRSVLDNQLSEMKKYSIFSKINISLNDRAILLGIAGHGAREALINFFYDVPDSERSILSKLDTTILRFSLPKERFLLVTTKIIHDRLLRSLNGLAEKSNSQQWMTLDIQSGYPIINIETAEKFIPQSINLQLLSGVSFNKGCYIGQEIVSRTKYRGANKRALYWLSGYAEKVPHPNDFMEFQIRNNWYNAGTVLAAIRTYNDSIWIQAVLNNNLPKNTKIRIKNNVNSNFTIKPLLYTIKE